MVDVAAISVVSSALLAGGTIIANFVGGERQRRHEADLSFEARVWERKSDALFAVIEQCQKIIDALPITSDKRRESMALGLSKALDVFEAHSATIEAFASKDARKALWDLIHFFRDSGVLAGAGNGVDDYRKRWINAILTSEEHKEDENAPRPEAFREWEKLLRRKAMESFDVDMHQTTELARRLRDAARESVRRPKD